MKIAIIGHGKMGKTIASLLPEFNLEDPIIIENETDGNWEQVQNCEVAIEFTQPHSAVPNLLRCFKQGIPVVSGTTGWLDQLPNVLTEMEKCGAGFFYAPNFSLGVNLFFELNKQLSQWMQAQEDYLPAIEEIHHTEKKDSPSGTAIHLAETIMKEVNRFKTWTLNADSAENELKIVAKREAEVPGTHEVLWTSKEDEIAIKHRAYGRRGFALGAVKAALFMRGRKGYFGMRDLLKMNS